MFQSIFEILLKLPTLDFYILLASSRGPESSGVIFFQFLNELVFLEEILDKAIVLSVSGSWKLLS